MYKSFTANRNVNQTIGQCCKLNAINMVKANLLTAQADLFDIIPLICLSWIIPSLCLASLMHCSFWEALGINFSAYHKQTSEKQISHPSWAAEYLHCVQLTGV